MLITTCAEEVENGAKPTSFRVAWFSQNLGIIIPICTIFEIPAHLVLVEIEARSQPCSAAAL